ncbi:carnitine O-acetyltransferase [Aplysia californica]|uniref:Carnitine O-acetyltransferase n=1 Tax=Aplysia californica TaxID=6500 RepID=A0ABM1A0L1_APLCA|nr:carnitine O-acetyltransferase [Aplysia californica]
MIRLLKRPVLQAATAFSKMGLEGTPRIPAKGRTFSVQYSLPRLPVPPLDQTLRKYLETVQPILTDDQLESTKQVVKRFQENEGPKLQALLEDRAQNHVNWLSDWWKSVAYLEPRDPVVVNVSPGIYMPRQEYRGQKQMLEFASKFIAGILEYKSMLEDQTVPVDQLGGKPLCMAQYYQLLNACRIPGLKKDTHVCVSPTDPNQPRHINVIHNNHIFSVDVVGAGGKPLSIDQIRQQLEQCLNQSQVPAVPVGILTSMDRGSWGHVYSQMVKDKANRASFENLQKSIFVVCLDGAYVPEEGISETDTGAAAMLHGLGSNNFSGNRWFDKTLQFIFNPDGHFGLNYEHTSAEGPALISFSDHALAYVERDIDPRVGATDVPPPKRLTFNFGDKTRLVINRGMEEVDSLVDDVMLRTMWFKDYGKKFIKQQKLSPDAFMQQAFQLAYFKMYGQPCATYESGSLRRFQQGRTETIRSCSVASLAFTTAMEDEAVPVNKKAELLRKAVQAHRKYTDETVAGQGIDRHLLGLKLTALENGMDIPQLFMDLSFKENCHFRLSTSQVASKSSIVLNFGPVVPDGYGICYNPQEDQLVLSVSSYNNSPQTNSEDFSELLRQSFLQMQKVLASQVQSKL